MRKLLGLAIAAALTGSTALATDLNVRVVSDTGLDMVTVPPGETVNYEVRGVLSSDTDNEGLGLFGFDLVFDGGALAQTSTPSSGPIASFVIPDGITNPAGFGGTATVPGREGDLVQVGGGLNTINNVENNAPYPTGGVVTGIGHTEEVLAAGSLTAPDVEGTYTLSLSNLFANVIKLGESEDGTYWAVEEANVGTIENLTIEVSACMIVSTNPPDCAIDARQPSKPDGTEPAGWDSIDITFSGTLCVAASPGEFTVSVEPSGTPPAITDVVVDGAMATLVLDGAIPTEAWTCFEVTGTPMKTCFGYLPADVSADSTSAPADILYLIDCLNGVRTCEMWQCDVDRSDMCGPPDILRVIDLLNGAGVYRSWLNVSIGACPSE